MRPFVRACFTLAYHTRCGTAFRAMTALPAHPICKCAPRSLLGGHIARQAHCAPLSGLGCGHSLRACVALAYHTRCGTAPRALTALPAHPICKSSPLFHAPQAHCTAGAPRSPVLTKLRRFPCVLHWQGKRAKQDGSASANRPAHALRKSAVSAPSCVRHGAFAMRMFPCSLLRRHIARQTHRHPAPTSMRRFRHAPAVTALRARRAAAQLDYLRSNANSTRSPARATMRRSAPKQRRSISPSQPAVTAPVTEVSSQLKDTLWPP